MTDNEQKLIHAVRRIVSAYGDRMKRAKNSTDYRDKNPSLSSFGEKISALEAVADEIEHGLEANVERIPYKNEVTTKYGDTPTIHEEHESFGMIKVSKVSGSQRLFGSHLDDHGHFMVLEIKRGVRDRSNGRDWYRGRRSIVSVAMTAAQYAEMISTAMNSGDGVPCTIEHVHHVQMDPVPVDEQSEHKAIRTQFKEQTAHVGARLEEAIEEVEGIIEAGKTISKGRAKEILGALQKAHRHYTGTSSFMVDQFRESTEKTVSAAKAEVEGMFALMIQRAGLDRLQKYGPAALKEDEAVLLFESSDGNPPKNPS